MSKNVAKKTKRRKSVELAFNGGVALSDTELWLSAATENGNSSHILTYNERQTPQWRLHDTAYSDAITRMASGPENFDGAVIHSRAGELGFLDRTGAFFSERIPGAGKCWYPPQGWTYLNGVRQIGGHLYACGCYAMVYKRHGPGDWRDHDQGMRQLPETEYEDVVSFQVVDGPHENAIYAAGHYQDEHLSPVACFYNGQHWRELALPERTGRMMDICAASEKKVWMCSISGKLLVGNADEGFRAVPMGEDRGMLHFKKLCLFQGKMYALADHHLFACDPQNPEDGIRQVVIDVDPPMRSTSSVTSHKDALWVTGEFDAARFDGQNWQRLHYPDNHDYTSYLKTADPDKQWDMAAAYYNAGNYAKAFEWYAKAAAGGNIYAQGSMGELYHMGLGVAQDYKKAFECYQKPAREGMTSAQGNLACLYEEGLGTAQDYKKAFEWYQKASETAWVYPWHKERLGNLYEKGLGTERDYEKAFEWYSVAAERGDEVAQRKLGTLYAEGRGVARDPAKARKWYESAAGQGDEEAKKLLGR